MPSLSSKGLNKRFKPPILGVKKQYAVISIKIALLPTLFSFEYKTDPIMKHFFIFICIFGSMLASVQVNAQADKDVIKQWKKKLKAMDPLAFKAMYEEHQQLKGEAASKERELSTLRREIAAKDAELTAKQAEIAELKEQVASMQTATNDDSQDVSPFSDDYTKGIVYKVQVGAFTKNTYSEKIDGQFWEEDADGTKKYTIGYFRDYQDATRFKNYLRAIGVSDAWIVAYEDNQRKDIKTILDADSSGDAGFDD